MSVLCQDIHTLHGNVMFAKPISQRDRCAVCSLLINYMRRGHLNDLFWDSGLLQSLHPNAGRSLIIINVTAAPIFRSASGKDALVRTAVELIRTRLNCVSLYPPSITRTLELTRSVTARKG